jgi:hypothetical protein
MAGPFQPAVVFTDRSLIAKIARTYENVGYPPKRNFMQDPPLNACAKTPPQSMRGRDAGRANLPGRTMEDDDPVSALFGACAALLGFSAGDPQGLAEDAHPAASGSRTEWHRHSDGLSAGAAQGGIHGLTDLGRALGPVYLALLAWSDLRSAQRETSRLASTGV